MPGGARQADPGRAARAHALYRAGEFRAALAELEAGDGETEDLPVEPYLRTSLLMRLGRVEDAIALHRKALLASDHPRARLALANMLRATGAIEEAAGEARAALRLDPALGEAWWTLANLKTVPLDDDDLAAMEQLLETPSLGNFDRACVYFALARAAEQRGNETVAWDHLVSANSLRRRDVRHDPDSLTALVDRMVRFYDGDFFAQRGDWGHPSPAPIFILGMPRSGSTLLERMLSMSGTVEAVGELPVMARCAGLLSNDRRKVDPSYLDRLAGLSAEAMSSLGQSYLDGVADYRKTPRPNFIDKMPNNWLLVGMIMAILPKARIIDVRRHPLDCGLSNYQENFSRGQAYSYELAHIGQYYRDYLRLMRHFDRIQPGRVQRVIYEQLVDDPERELRRLCSAIGLAFSPAMVEFHTATAPVRTASAAQVRQPLNRSGIGRWRKYAPQLQPLVHALGDDLQDWDAGLRK